MPLKFAKRMDNIKASEIRELLKIAQKPGIISFGGGFPAPELFPVEELIKVTKSVLEKHGTTALQYGPTEGYQPLREGIAKRMKNVSAIVNPDDILITNGSQQGLDFTDRKSVV